MYQARSKDLTISVKLDNVEDMEYFRWDNSKIFLFVVFSWNLAFTQKSAETSSFSNRGTFDRVESFSTDTSNNLAYLLF